MLTAAVCYLALHAVPDYRKSLQTFLEADRAFARTSTLAGIRESHLQWYADDGIGFGADVIKRREEISKTPAEEKPFTILMLWDPKIADCSSEGDLGFTTGPYRVMDMAKENISVQHGAYFSIWRRQKDNSMKVVLGLSTPLKEAATYPTPFRVPAQPKVSFVTADLQDRARDGIARFEEDIAKSTADELGGTMNQLYDPKPIVYRQGATPIMSSGDAVKWWKDSKPALKEWTVLQTVIAGSADFAYCYGKYEDQNNKGYFVHVWKSEYGKGWHIVADAMSVGRQ